MSVKQCRAVIPRRVETSEVSPTIARPAGGSPHCYREEDPEGAAVFLELGRQSWESRNPGWLELTRQHQRGHGYRTALGDLQRASSSHP